MLIREADDKPNDPAKAFEQEAKRQAKELPRLVGDTEAEINRLLDQASGEIRELLQRQPSDYQQWALPQVQDAITRVGTQIGGEIAITTADAASSAWTAGVALVDAPLAAAGIALAGVLPSIDPRQLMAMRTFLTSKMTEVTADQVAKVNAELGLVVIGARPVPEAVDRVEQLLGNRGRAITVIRTELGTAYATAAQERQMQASQLLPGLRKQWRRSGKLHSRPSHDIADGQIVGVDEPFRVGGTKIMFPRDPAAPPGHRINCGCISLPYMDHWEVQHPGINPITDAERGDKNKHRIADIQDQAFASWARRITNKKLHPQGNWETVAAMPQALQQALTVRGVAFRSPDLGISDRQLVHLVRDGKKYPLPKSAIQRLPAMLANPLKVVREKGPKADPNTLIFLAEVPETRRTAPGRVAKLVVKLGDEEKRSRRKIHNWVASGKMERLDVFSNEGDFEELYKRPLPEVDRGPVDVGRIE